MFLKSQDKKIKNSSKHVLPSIISSDAQFYGNIISNGEIQIDGHVIGDIQAQTLTIHANARIQGSVIAEKIELHGQIVGNVHARAVHMFPQSSIEGDVIHQNITIETGAFINGQCRRQTFNPPNPPELDAKKQKNEKTDPANIYQYPSGGQDVA